MPGITKCGVVLVNTGTPSNPTPRAVRKYLSQFLTNNRIAPMNSFIWWFIVHLSILPKRGRSSSAKYEKVWTADGSPLMVAHEKITKGLTASFQELGYSDVEVRHAMSYGSPSIGETLGELREACCEQLIVLPMYPQSAYSTTGVVFDAMEHNLRKLKWDVPYHLIDNYHDNALYVRTLAASIKYAGFDASLNDKVIFSFHSVPLSDIELGDTYELQTGASSLQIASSLGIDRTSWTIGYQSRFQNNSSWLSPFTTDVLDRWAEAGVGRVFFVCPGFSVDCLETLYDIEFELKPYYFERVESKRDQVETDFIYVPCLDKSKAHIKVLVDILRPYVEEFRNG